MAGTGGEPAPHEYRVLDRETVFEGPVISLHRERVAMPGGAEAVRDIVRHPGAVAVVAVDDADRVVLVRQYRHAFGRHLWELPAGLCDADGEPGPGRGHDSAPFTAVSTGAPTGAVRSRTGISTGSRSAAR